MLTDDPLTTRAQRRRLCQDEDGFVDNVVESQRHFTAAFPWQRTGACGPPRRPMARIEDVLAPHELAGAKEISVVSLPGCPSTAQEQMTALLEAMHADERMVTAHVHDHSARLRSYELLAGSP